MQHIDSDLAHRFLKNQLDSSGLNAIRQHLEACEQCAALVRDERAFHNLLTIAPSPTPPEGGADRLLTRLDSVISINRWRRWRRPALFAAVAAVLVTFAAVGVHSLRTAPRVENDIAARLGITRDLQDTVVSQLDALATITADPWLLGDYEVVESLSGQMERRAN